MNAEAVHSSMMSQGLNSVSQSSLSSDENILEFKKTGAVPLYFAEEENEIVKEEEIVFVRGDLLEDESPKKKDGNDVCVLRDLLSKYTGSDDGLDVDELLKECCLEDDM
jgi:hypothetical protein